MLRLPNKYQILMASQEKSVEIKENTVSFFAIIRKTKKGHWYVTIPPTIKELIQWEKKKVIKITLEPVL